MYFSAWCFYLMAAVTVSKLRSDRKRGGYIIPDFMSSGYDETTLKAFKRVPKELVDKHYRLDGWYILLYVLASVLASFAAGNIPTGLGWIPGALGAITAVLDFFENQLLKGYYSGSYNPWMPRVAPRITRAKSFFAWGWFLTAPAWLIWDALAS